MKNRKTGLFEADHVGSSTMLHKGSRPKNNLVSDSKMVIPGPVVNGNMDLSAEDGASNLAGFTRNNVQIADVFMLYAQQKLMSVIDEKEIYLKAYKEIEPLIKKYNLDSEDEDSEIVESREQKRSNTKTVNSLLSAKVRELVAEAFVGETKLVIDFQDFIKNLNITSLHRGNGGIYLKKFNDLLKDSQTKAVLNCRFETYKEEGEVLSHETVFVGYHLVPSWSIVIKGEEETGHYFGSFEDLVKSQKKHKEQYIKRIEFDFNPAAMAVFALPRIESGYSITDRIDRVDFGKYAFQLDWIVRSRYKMQHMEKGNYFELEGLMKMFGTKYIQYKDFNSRVLQPAIKEINEGGDIFVSFIAHKKQKKVIGIEFIVKRNFGGERDDSGVLVNFPLSYFIACKHYYSNRYVTLGQDEFSTFDEYYADIKDFAKSFYKNKDIKYYQDDNDLTLQEWKYLYDEEVLAWKDLSRVYRENSLYFAKKNWILSGDKLGIVDELGEHYISPLKSLGGPALELPSEQIEYLSEALSDR